MAKKSYVSKLFRTPNGHTLKKKKGVTPYVFEEQTLIALDAALATGRPLLVYGEPGTGKSRLAEAVAACHGASFLRVTMTSRMRLDDLTAGIDQLRRLNDANANAPQRPDAFYLKPGVFWWAFEPDSARRRGLSPDDADTHGVDLRFPGDERNGDARRTVARSTGADLDCVLLIDEIDKAEPDLPNDLLEPLERLSFDLPEGFRVADRAAIHAPDDLRVLMIVASNRERELPQAFLRRCVALELPEPDADRLVKIARQHYPEADEDTVAALARLTLKLREQARDQGIRAPGTAEFLDAVQACETLSVDVPAEGEPADPVWAQLERAVLTKGSNP
ncbi:MAG: AAA family ATPase [Gammaproteobacteria bacterium]